MELQQQKNSFGRTSKLSLVIAPEKIRQLFFTAPYKILRPFHQGDFLQIMVVKVSAGLMAGDCQDFDIQLEDHAKAEFLSQSYEKSIAWIQEKPHVPDISA